MMILRAALAAALAVGILITPIVAEAQPAAKVPRIGYLVTGSLESPETRVALDAFRQGLRERGYVEGQNILIEYRAADGKIERFPGLATELARLKVDLILAANTPAARAAQQATTTIPIVVPVIGDPVGDGLVASLARPGGNITGLSGINPELSGKRLDLLKQAVPRLTRVAIVWNPAEPNAAFLRETQAAGRGLSMQLQVLEVKAAPDLETALQAARRWHASGLIVLTDPVTLYHRKQLADLANKYRLPAIYSERLFVESGGLISYGANDRKMHQRAAIYVDKILKGAKPGDLPIEQPTKFELIINLKTAKALGLTIPPSLLQRADQVIE